jgi:hypothetical protein
MSAMTESTRQGWLAGPRVPPAITVDIRMDRGGRHGGGVMTEAEREVIEAAREFAKLTEAYAKVQLIKGQERGQRRRFEALQRGVRLGEARGILHAALVVQAEEMRLPMKSFAVPLYQIRKMALERAVRRWLRRLKNGRDA